MKRLPAILLTLAVVLVIVLPQALSGGPGTAASRPPLGRQLETPPTCAKLPVSQHVMGACLPHPKVPIGQRPALAQSSPIQGPDLSNNDPVYGTGAWHAIAARSRFAYLKSVEGTGYYDSTAAPMAAAAKANGLPVGGYDFLHVCGDSASAEAAHFVAALRAQKLLGPGTLPPAADAEYGSGGCGGRSWLQAWVNTVYALDGHVCPDEYTGAWWSNPNLGSFWPTCAGHDLISWISGYGVNWPYMPSGLSHLDIWQSSDHFFNGASYGDWSSWMHDAASFTAFANTTPPPPPDPYAIYVKTVFSFGKVRASEYADVKRWDAFKCRNPVIRQICVSDRAHLVLLSKRLWYVAHHPVIGGPRAKQGTWSFANRGVRFQGIWHRLGH